MRSQHRDVEGDLPPNTFLPLLGIATGSDASSAPIRRIKPCCCPYFTAVYCGSFDHYRLSCAVVVTTALPDELISEKNSIY
ncbi:hypothetical protein OAL43_00790 [bacterium]|nr:hypothetical protein [bacterium]